MSVYARPRPGFQSRAGVSPARVGEADASFSRLGSVGRRDACPTLPAQVLGIQFKRLFAVLLFALSFSPTSLWACAACTGRTDSPLAVAMNWGILTLLCVVLTVLSVVLVFFVHVIRKEEAASNDTPPENPPKT